MGRKVVSVFRNRWFLLGVMGIVVTLCSPEPGNAAGAYDELVKAAKAEIEKKGGKLAISLEWAKRDVRNVLKALKKTYPFIKEVTFERMRGVAPYQRLLMSSQQGMPPGIDILRVPSEVWSQYEKAGVFVKPPFNYKELAKSLPPGWPELDARAIGPNGMFVATAGLARGNAWNPELVPQGREPTTWEACLDPKLKGNFLYDPRPKLTALWYNVETREQHINWLKGIMKNGVVLNRGQTENLQKVAAGEFPVVCGVNYHSSFRMIDRGAPLKFAFPDPVPLELGTQIHLVSWSKTPAMTQLFALWLATGAQELVEKDAYRGFPWDKRSRKYPLAKGKKIALCDAGCMLKGEEYDRLHSDLLGLPGVR